MAANSDADLKTIREARAKKSIENLLAHWHRGQHANHSECPPREMAVKLGVNPNTLRKERTFAHVYSKRDLDRLIQLRRASGVPLHWGHVVYLITVPDRPTRRALEIQAVKHDWLPAELLAAIQRKRPSTGRGGRPQKVPASLAGQLKLLRDECDRWLNRFEAIAVEGNMLERLSQVQASTRERRTLAASAALLARQATKLSRACGRDN